MADIVRRRPEYLPDGSGVFLQGTYSFHDLLAIILNNQLSFPDAPVSEKSVVDLMEANDDDLERLQREADRIQSRITQMRERMIMARALAESFGVVTPKPPNNTDQ